MNIADYQEQSRETWQSIDRMTDELHALIGLSGEVGELHEKVKKLHRDEYPKCADMNCVRLARTAAKLAISKELGDIAYYLCRVADQYGINMADVLFQNLEKIRDRKARGVLSGSGDER